MRRADGMNASETVFIEAPQSTVFQMGAGRAGRRLYGVRPAFMGGMSHRIVTGPEPAASIHVSQIRGVVPFGLSLSKTGCTQSLVWFDRLTTNGELFSVQFTSRNSTARNRMRTRANQVQRS